jgi:hypothetical protein
LARKATSVLFSHCSKRSGVDFDATTRREARHRRERETPAMNVMCRAGTVLLLTGSACLDLDETGKLFACPDCPVDGGDSGNGSDAGDGGHGMDGGMDGGMNGGSDGGDLCMGVVCNAAPAAHCVDANTLRVFSNPGACQSGACVYGSADVSCACASDRCTQDLCAGVVCNQPPASMCSAQGELVTAAAQGTCSASSGICSYSTTIAACPSGQQCSQGACVCTPESDSAFCSRLGASCDAVTAADNCGTSRTVSCGSCATPQVCGGGGTANVCGGGRISFTSGWQVIPGTGSQVVSVKCQGTVTTTPTGGTRCELAAGNPVLIGIDGSTYNLYGGCTTNTTLHNCMTDITPAGADYLEAQSGSVARLLCAAMGWTLANTQSDRITTADGAPTAPVAVVQTNPAVIGTADLANYSTYVDCEP